MSRETEALRRRAEKRADIMIAQKEGGKTLQQIANKHGISRQRVHEIIKWRRES